MNVSPARTRRRRLASAAGVVVVAGAVVAGIVAGGGSEPDASRAAAEHTPAVATSPSGPPAAADSPASAEPSPSGSPGPVDETAAAPGPMGATSARQTPARSASPNVVQQASGDLDVVPGTGPVTGTGPLRQYVVEVERGTGEDGKAFAAAVERILGDARGWGHDGRLSFQRVDSGPVDFRVTLASPGTTDKLCLPLDTIGSLSCYNGRGRSVINDMRWQLGAEAYPDDLPTYRDYLISHEVGHALGHHHVFECAPDGLAQAMQQQTKTLAGCAPNPWPYPGK